MDQTPKSPGPSGSHQKVRRPRKRKLQYRPPTKDEIAERIRKLVIVFYPADLKHWEERYEFDCRRVGMIEHLTEEIFNGNINAPVKKEAP